MNPQVGGKVDIYNQNKQIIDSGVAGFINSKSIPDAITRLATELPEELIKNIVLRYVNVINSVLSKILFYLGISLAASDEDVEKILGEVTGKIKLLSWVLYKALEDARTPLRIVQINKNSLDVTKSIYNITNLNIEYKQNGTVLTLQTTQLFNKSSISSSTTIPELAVGRER